MKRSLWGWVLLCTLSAVNLALSQNATTSLRGVVKDPSGALVSGATITLTDSSTGKTFSTIASSTGLYEFPQIFPSKYTIKVTAPGFGEQSKIAELLVNQPATVDFTLTVQSSSVTVDVTAAAQTLNTADASLGSSADAAEIQALPSETRNVPDLLSLQPGVLYLPPTITDSRSGAVNGGRSDQGNVTIDGIDDNDQVNGFAFTGVLRETQDSIEEFRVTTGDANADAGRSSGAQVSLVTKSGTNKFHGAAYEYNRPTITVANDWFNKQAELNSGEPNIPGKLIRNIFGGAVGGPIKKDKLFFFGNYEGSRIAENVPGDTNHADRKLRRRESSAILTVMGIRNRSLPARLLRWMRVCRSVIQAHIPSPRGRIPTRLAISTRCRPPTDRPKATAVITPARIHSHRPILFA